MLENQILDTIDKISAGTLSNAERSILVADIKSDLSNTRLASSNGLINIAMQKLNSLKKGEYEEQPKTFQDFSETNSNSTPFKVINQEEIDKFLDKMSNSNTNEDVFFNDTWEFYHPVENMKAEGLPRHRSDFNAKS